MSRPSDASPPDREPRLRAWADDATAAAMFLTRLPVGRRDARPAGLDGRAQRAFPLIGAAIGLAGGAVYAAAAGLGLPPPAAAVLAVAAQIGLTGALHEDGLADVADGLGGGDREQTLAIMRDSRIGSYGALALILAVGGRVAALAALAAPGAVIAALVAGGALSRALVPAVTRWLGPARPDGLAATAGRPDGAAVFTAVALGLLLTLLATGFAAGTVALVAGAAAAAAAAGLARRRIGGYTGDVLGAVQQLGELAVLFALAARA